MYSRTRSATLVLILGVAVAAVSAQTADPRIGTWTLNVEKSKYDPGPAPKSHTVKVEASGLGEKVTSEVTAADGTRTTQQYSANYDGKDHPLTGSPIADTVSLTRIDTHTTERVDKKGGKAVQTIRRVVSKDGKTMTATVKGTNATGQAVSNVSVFEKK